LPGAAIDSHYFKKWANYSKQNDGWRQAEKIYSKLRLLIFLSALPELREDSRGRQIRQFSRLPHVRQLSADPPMTQTLANAIAALRAGRLREAEDVCRELLARNPADANIYNLLGAIAGTAGDHAKAAEFMRRSVELAPDVIEFRKNLARAQLRQGRITDAEETLRTAVARNPELPQLLGLWGVILGQRGDLAAAIEALEKAVRGCPHDPLNQFNLADLYRRTGDRKRAIANLQQVLNLAPGHPDALNNLAGLQLAEGDFLDALGSIQRLLKANPKSVQGYCNLGVLLAAAGDAQSAETALRNALVLDPSLVRARFDLANQLLAVGKLEEAERLIRELRCTKESDRLSLKLAHARILEHQGDIAGAAAILNTIDEQERRDPEAATIYAIVLEQQGKAEEALAVLEAALKSHELAAIAGIGIHFSLGDLYDSLGRYDEAFGAYSVGNANRKKAFIKIDRPSESGTAVSQKLIDLYSLERYRQCPFSTLDTQVPVFIVGMPRSGTSLTEQILASHSQVYGAGELTALRDYVRQSYEVAGEKKPWSPLEIVDINSADDTERMAPNGWETITAEQLAKLGQKYLDYIRGVGGDASRITDKMPYNYMLAPLIAKIFPRGRIIHCRRNPLDTCLSCFCQNFTAGSEYAFDLAELGAFYRDYLTAARP
jgi:Flp pilus assembly protein TadD